VIAEMALSIPILVALMMGSFELGAYFLAEHKVIKAVRDGARYASRQPFTDYASCTPSSTLITNTRNVTRTGQVSSGGTPRLGYWTDPNTITVTVTCDTGGSYSTAGIYTGSTQGAPVVTVNAAVPYTPLVGTLGITRASLTLNAHSQAAVDGI
jgi:Flp pilus assembly protein TadG